MAPVLLAVVVIAIEVAEESRDAEPSGDEVSQSGEAETELSRTLLDGLDSAEVDREATAVDPGDADVAEEGIGDSHARATQATDRGVRPVPAGHFSERRAQADEGPEDRPLELCEALAEACDGIDNDCDGTTDEEGAIGCVVYYRDIDGDTFGSGDPAGCLCEPSLGLSENDLDCDDRQALIHPGLPEECDGLVDNDCDGIIDTCGTELIYDVRPGDLRITQVMADPDSVGDAHGEWFEILNTSPFDIDLMGMFVSDGRWDAFVVEVSLVVPAGETVVFARDPDLSRNGGVKVDYAYSDFTLGNSGDAIVLENDDFVLAEFEYGEEDLGPPGQSLMPLALVEQ